MTLSRLFISYVALSLLALCPACGNDVSEKSGSDTLHDIQYSHGDSLSSGKVQLGHYINSYFGFSAPVPDSTWEILNAEQYDQRLEANMNDVEASQSSTEKTKENITNLFTFRKKTGAKGEGAYQGISFMAERIEKIPDVHNALEYMKWTDKFVREKLSSGFPRYRPHEIDTGYIGDRVFLHSTWEIETESGDVYYQENYTAMFGEYLLNIIVNYQTPEEADENKKYLSKVQWN